MNLLTKLKNLKSTKANKQIEESATINSVAEFPKPYNGEGSGIHYNKNPQLKNIQENKILTVNFAELKPNDLMPHYLKYVLNNAIEGVYRKVSKEVANDLGISEDKADRIRKKAIESGYLVPQLEKKTILNVQESKIRRVIR